MDTQTLLCESTLRPSPGPVPAPSEKRFTALVVGFNEPICPVCVSSNQTRPLLSTATPPIKVLLQVVGVTPAVGQMLLATEKTLLAWVVGLYSPIVSAPCSLNQRLPALSR